MYMSGQVVPAEIIGETLGSFHISLWVPAHAAIDDGRWIPGERKTRYIFKDDTRIIDIDENYVTVSDDNVVDIFVAQKDFLMKLLG